VGTTMRNRRWIRDGTVAKRLHGRILYISEETMRK
jgi:hypothetical protein